MTVTDRLSAIAKLRTIAGVKTHLDLMNFLQDRGLVSDNCVQLEEVADCDLNYALKKLAL